MIQKGTNWVARRPVSRLNMQRYIPTYYSIRKREPSIALGSNKKGEGVRGGLISTSAVPHFAQMWVYAVHKKGGSGTNTESRLLEGTIIIEEAGIALKIMTNGKSPGTDGFGAEFESVFGSSYDPFVVRALNKA